MHALVYVDRVFREEPFCVSVTAGLESLVLAGCQVVVSLLHQRASASIGYVSDLILSEPVQPVEGELVDVLHDGLPVLPPSLLQLSIWIADYYVSRPIDSINSALPAPVRALVDDLVELNAFMLRSPDMKVVNTSLRRAILKELGTAKKLTVRQLRKRLGGRQLYATLSEMQRGGLVSIRKKLVSGKQKTVAAWRLVRPAPDNLAQLLSRSPKKKRAIDLLEESDKPFLLAGEYGISGRLLKALACTGAVEQFAVTVQSSYDTSFNEPPKTIRALSSAQQQALDMLVDVSRKKSFRTFLLHGVTGSGKTMVYIELLRKVLEAGRNAIVLVPEIALTPQAASRFSHYFKDDIQIMHSAMSSQEKFDAWQRLRQGKARIALGARSTIFAPLENVGAIIVDEEHDTAYKQDRTPRYHGRDTAVMRAKLENAVCVLGSATPSFESFSNALSGKYTLLSLPDRIDHAAMPSIRLVWMPESQKITPSISGQLYEGIRKRLERNEQIILLQNRRGFSGSVLCLDCGHTPQCRFCNIPLVFHAGDESLRCHYCGHTTAFRKTCVHCSSGNLFYKGSGTERIEEELRKLFPDEHILRMDVDTTSSKGSHGRILSDFHEKKSRILLGTQMVAKGLDFPDVTLVGVLMADIGLNIPDFRASERLYSLLMQVAGRAGRSAAPGEVFLQMYKRDNELFGHLLHGDYRRFFQAEMESRAELGYPPAAKLMKFEFSSPAESVASKAATAFLEHLQPHIPQDRGQLLGPAPAGITRIKGRYRFQLLLKLFGFRPPSALIRQLQQEITTAFRQENISVSVDVDPQNLL